MELQDPQELLEQRVQLAALELLEEVLLGLQARQAQLGQLVGQAGLELLEVLVLQAGLELLEVQVG